MRKVVSAVVIAAVLTAPRLEARAAPSQLAVPGADSWSSIASQRFKPDKLSVSPTTLQPGGKVTISGSGCPGETVSLIANAHALSGARKLASMPAGLDGTFTGVTKLPGSLGLGIHTLSAVCADQLVGSERIRLVTQGFVATAGAAGNLEVSRSAVRAGGTVKIFAQPCPAGDLAADLDTTRVMVAAPARAGAGLEAEVTIPAGARPGMHTLFTHCDGLLLGAATLRVIATGGSLPAPLDRSSAPRTNLLFGAAAGLMFLIVGGGLVLMILKRHRHRTATPGYFDLPSSHRAVR